MQDSARSEDSRSRSVKLPRIKENPNIYEQKVNFSRQNKQKLRQLNEKKRQQALDKVRLEELKVQKQENLRNRILAEIQRKKTPGEEQRQLSEEAFS